MAQAYSRNSATLAAATATRLSTLLAAEGYTGRMVGAFLEIIDDIGDMVMADSATNISTTGRVVGSFSRTAPPAVDPSRIWLYSATGGNFTLTFEPA